MLYITNIIYNWEMIRPKRVKMYIKKNEDGCVILQPVCVMLKRPGGA